MVSKHHKGVVAAGHTSTAQAGADILAAGGNAFDAAIASLAMACVCEPVLASPGGGGFAIAACGDGPVSLIDFFVQTPLLRRQIGETGCLEVLADFGTATQAFHIGPATSATPGFLPGLSEIHKFGASMPMSTLLKPAIEAARQGVVVTKFQAYLASVVAPILKASPQATALFAPDGELHQEGAVLCNPALSQAFEAYLYDEAQLRDEMVSAQKAHGNLTASDFDAYRAITRTPLEVELGGLKWRVAMKFIQ